MTIYLSRSQTPHISGAIASCMPVCYYQWRSYSESVKTVSLLKDGVFKSIFGNQNNTKPLKSFLESVCSVRDIGSIQHQDPYFPAFSAGEKDIYMDVVCKSWDEKGEDPQLHVMEMQQVENEGYVKRWEFYASRCFTHELQKAKTYDKLIPTHVVALMVHPCKYPDDNYTLVGSNHGVRIHESRTITLLSLNNIQPNISNEDSLRNKWLHLIRYSGSSMLNTGVMMAHPTLSFVVKELEAIKRENKVFKKAERTSTGAPWHILKRKIKNQITSSNK